MLPAAAGNGGYGMAKATDSLGRTQPVDRDENRGGYIVNHVLPMEIDVR